MHSFHLRHLRVVLLSFRDAKISKMAFDTACCLNRFIIHLLGDFSFDTFEIRIPRSLGNRLQFTVCMSMALDNITVSPRKRGANFALGYQFFGHVPQHTLRGPLMMIQLYLQLLPTDWILCGFFRSCALLLFSGCYWYLQVCHAWSERKSTASLFNFTATLAELSLSCNSDISATSCCIFSFCRVTVLRVVVSWWCSRLTDVWLSDANIRVVVVLFTADPKVPTCFHVSWEYLVRYISANTRLCCILTAVSFAYLQQEARAFVYSFSTSYYTSTFLCFSRCSSAIFSALLVSYVTVKWHCRI